MPLVPTRSFILTCVGFCMYSQDRKCAHALRSSNIELKITQQQIDGFKEKHYLLEETELTFNRMFAKDRILFGGKIYPINKMKPAKIFTDDATYMHDGVEDELPQINVLQMEDNEEIVTVEKTHDGEINTIMILNKENGLTVELVKIARDIVVAIQHSDYDTNRLNEAFQYGIIANKQHDRAVNSSLSSATEIGTNKDQLGRSILCTSYKQIELAVVYESSYCGNYGYDKEKADASVLSLVATVSSRFKQTFLCMEVIVSHLEGYCNNTTDPFQQLVNMNESGCESKGLLGHFRDYWNELRVHVSRDTAHLLTGTHFECKPNRTCTIGCATLSSTCNVNLAYGVSYTTFTNSSVLRSTLVAHEVGHNNGASHIKMGGNIMSENVGSAKNGFSWDSIKYMNAYFEQKACLEEIEGTSEENYLDILMRWVQIFVSVWKYTFSLVCDETCSSFIPDFMPIGDRI